MHVHVQNGTGAGRKKPLREPSEDWICDCDDGAAIEGDDITWYDGYLPLRFRPGYLVNCPDCGARRPD